MTTTLTAGMPALEEAGAKYYQELGALEREIRKLMVWLNEFCPVDKQNGIAVLPDDCQFQKLGASARLSNLVRTADPFVISLGENPSDESRLAFCRLVADGWLDRLRAWFSLKTQPHAAANEKFREFELPQPPGS